MENNNTPAVKDTAKHSVKGFIAALNAKQHFCVPPRFTPKNRQKNTWNSSFCRTEKRKQNRRKSEKLKSKTEKQNVRLEEIQ